MLRFRQVKTTPGKLVSGLLHLISLNAQQKEEEREDHVNDKNDEVHLIQDFDCSARRSRLFVSDLLHLCVIHWERVPVLIVKPVRRERGLESDQ